MYFILRGKLDIPRTMKLNIVINNYVIDQYQSKFWHFPFLTKNPLHRYQALLAKFYGIIPKKYIFRLISVCLETKTDRFIRFLSNCITTPSHLSNKLNLLNWIHMRKAYKFWYHENHKLFYSVVLTYSMMQPNSPINFLHYTYKEFLNCRRNDRNNYVLKWILISPHLHQKHVTTILY